MSVRQSGPGQWLVLVLLLSTAFSSLWLLRRDTEVAVATNLKQRHDITTLKSLVVAGAGLGWLVLV